MTRLFARIDNHIVLLLRRIVTGVVSYSVSTSTVTEVMVLRGRRGRAVITHRLQLCVRRGLAGNYRVGLTAC